MKKILLWVAILVMSATRMMASPAYPGLIKFQQPHSDITLNIYLKGDERVHWAETEDGYSLVHADNGTLMYATTNEAGDMIPSTYMATDFKDRTPEVLAFLGNTKKHITFSKSQVDQMQNIWTDMSQMKYAPKTMSDVTGEKKFLVILFQFPDLSFSHRASEFKNLFNQVGYSVNHSTGSVHDYYFDVSHGMFSLSVDVVGPYTAINGFAHYGESDGYQDFAEEAVENASHDVDFSNYDNDGDGFIDGLHIIFAGHGEEAGASSDHIWSHKWNIFSAPVYNNTTVDVYSCSPECSGNQDANLTAIGVICHELGHVFGAPDYYDTDYAGSGGEYPGLGKWDIMSSGSWNNSGRTPAHHNPYTKAYIYRWINIDTLDNPQSVTLHSVAESANHTYRINTSTPGDFFLVENRQQIKWDNRLPGHGLIVYHIHPNAHGASVNNARHPQQIYVMAATSSSDTVPTNSPSSYGDPNSSSASLPGSANRTQLTDFTSPRLRPWSQALNNSPITNISENNSAHTVSFCFKNATAQSSDLSALGVSNSHIKTHWDNYGSYTSILLISKTNQFGTPTSPLHVGDTLPGGGIVAYRGNAGDLMLDSLEASTTYYLCLYTHLTDSTFSTPIYAQATTMDCGATDWTEENFNQLANGEMPSCWTSLNDAYGWHVTSNSDRDPYLTTANTALNNDAYLFQIITTPIANSDSATNIIFSFDARLNNATDENPLMVLYRKAIDAQWDTILTIAGDNLGEWNTYYAELKAPTQYSLLSFAFMHTNQASADLDNLLLRDGYLVHAYASEGGTISPSGYHVYQAGDSITFVALRNGGYRLKGIYLDDYSVMNDVDTSRVPTYVLPVRRSCTLRASFERDLDIEEVATVVPALFPNPTTGRVNIENIPAEVNALHIFDILGRHIATCPVTDSTMTIDMSLFDRGMYLIRVGESFLKVIKE